MGYRLYGEVSGRMQWLTFVVGIVFPVLVAAVVLWLVYLGVNVPRWVIGILGGMIFAVFMIMTKIARRSVK
jgi:small basic protein